MLTRFLIIGLLVALVGCKKPKPTAASRDDTANTKQQQLTPPTPTSNNKNSKKDEPNWLTDPRFKKDKEQPKFELGQPGQTDPQPGSGGTPGIGSGKQPLGIAPPKDGWNPPVPGVELPGPGGPGVLPMPGPGGIPPMPGVIPPPPVPGIGGVPQPNPNPPPLPGGNTPIGATKKSVAKADMRDLQIFIHDASLASGQMPTPGDIFDALVKARSPVAEHVKAGSIILTGAKERESVWAYETRALTNGGLVLSQNGVETLSAADLRQRLGK